MNSCRAQLCSAHFDTSSVALRCFYELWVLEWVKVEFLKLQKPIFKPDSKGYPQMMHHSLSVWPM